MAEKLKRAAQLSVKESGLVLSKGGDSTEGQLPVVDKSGEEVVYGRNYEAMLLILEKIDKKLEREGLRKNGKFTAEGEKKLKESERRHQREIQQWVRKKMEAAGHVKNGELTEKFFAETGITLPIAERAQEMGLVNNGKLTDKAKSELDEISQAQLSCLLSLESDSIE